MLILKIIMTIVFIEVPIPRQERERFCICAILPLFTIFLLDIGTVPTVWYYSFFMLSTHYRHIYSIV